MFSTPSPLCKIRSRHPREFKLTEMIAYIMFYKICKFESSTITNDVITKTMVNFARNKYYIIRKVLMRAIQTCTFFEFISLCQKLWAFLSNFGLFRMSAHQISSCQVTQEVNFENVLFYPNSTLNIRKSHKISSGKALYFRSYQAKPQGGGGGGEHPQYL